MIKIITAINNPEINKELEKEDEVEILCKDIQYKEGILEILENNIKIDYIIIDENIPGEKTIDKLIEEILEKDEKIKIIITIKKENKNKYIFNNKKIIKIIYENNITLTKIKEYKFSKEETNIKKINKQKKHSKKNKINTLKIKDKMKSKIKNIKKNRHKKNKDEYKNKINDKKIITIIGEERVGKSITIINFANYLKTEKSKILIIELKKQEQNILTIFGCKKLIIKINKKSKRIKKYKKINKKYKKIYINKKIIKNMITKVNNNIDIISFNKIINYKIIQDLKKNYNYILIETDPKKINKKILNNSDENILLLRANLLGIKNSKKIIEKNNIYNFNNIKIILNNYNKYSIDERIIKKIFNPNKVIGKIFYIKEYENLINKNLKGIKINNKKYKYTIKNILDKII